MFMYRKIIRHSRVIETLVSSQPSFMLSSSTINDTFHESLNNRIPRHKTNDYSEEFAMKRREFIKEKHFNNNDDDDDGNHKEEELSLKHISSYSFKPELLKGNVENFIGVAQIPIGLSGPMLIDGENAKGEYYIPLATSEGTLIASYSRGMRITKACGGIKTTIIDQRMQRAPVFLFNDARQALLFGKWIIQNFNLIKEQAETTTQSGKLIDISQYSIGPNLYLRFNYTTKDAAGQNMCGKATYAACEWIVKNYNNDDDISMNTDSVIDENNSTNGGSGNGGNVGVSGEKGKLRYMLSGSIDTDKKHSQMNMINIRGRKVIAEIILKKEVLKELGGVTPEQLFEYRQIGNVGSQLAGSAYNGAHAANGLTALFIATGQDVANVSESHAGITYTQLLPNGDYYWSVTLPALIVATHGGGTGLPTQRECLNIMQCGEGSVNPSNKLAELCAATVLAGDISLTCAVLAGDWVSSHDKYGRNK